MKQIFNFCAVAVFVFTMLCSCAGNPPKDERELAERAFKEAGVAKDCDRENYLAAEELLNKAREEVNRKNYDTAKVLFGMVKDKSEAITKYYRDHPDKCMPSSGGGGLVSCPDGDCDGDGEPDDITDSNDPYSPKNPDMEFQVVHFEYNKYEVLEEDLPKIDLMAEWMMNFPEKVIIIEGHADERGTNDYNLHLSEKRANAVKNKLIQAGIDAERMSIVPYGEERPVDPASNEEAWFKNRRAEFKRAN